MNEQKHLPDVERLSVVIALILLAYATTAFITLPTRSLNLQLPGILLVISLNFSTVVAVVTAVLAAAGVEWVVTSHPNLSAQQYYQHWHHWLVPAFSAVAIGITLGTLPVGPAWWTVFGLGGVFLAAVLTIEYISADPADLRYSFAVLGLDAVSFALFLIIVAAISGADLRLYILLAAIIPVVFLISTRSLFLRLRGVWHVGWGAGIALILTQLAAAMFYLPLRPLQFGLILLGVLYGLISLASNIEEKANRRTLWIEPLVVALAFTLLGLLLR